ncbi:MAG TPA: hypothetical protein VGE74_20415 [Gemmata sp.]
MFALAGCKSADRDNPGIGRRPDPLMAREGRLIPQQNLPVPERGIGSKGKLDPLTAPVGGRGDKVGYTDDPERFKGTVLPGERSTPAALAGRIRDGDELKIESPGVKLQPTAGVLPEDAGQGVSGLFDQLEKMGVKRADRTLEREDGKYVFRASVPLTAEGARRQYSGAGDTPYEAVKQVVDQLAERK